MHQLQAEVDSKLLEIRKDRKVDPQTDLLKICSTLITSSAERTKPTSSMEEPVDVPPISSETPPAGGTPA
jgi:hypothetical protein